jgi:hypothetical protein
MRVRFNHTIVSLFNLLSQDFFNVFTKQNHLLIKKNFSIATNEVYKQTEKIR